MTNGNGNGNGYGAKWVVGSSVAAIIAAGAAVVIPLIAVQSYQSQEIKEMRDIGVRFIESMMLESYRNGERDTKLTAIMKVDDKQDLALEQLDTDLQREMRDINSITEAKLQGLDSRLQGELSNVSSILNESINRTHESMKANELRFEDMLERQNSNREEIAKQQERWDLLQRLYDRDKRPSP